ncbi:ThuA domain-containing protein [Phycisphaera mikurensis]|uniref:ThuA-like domain-containing protein n=1 Tax=Phycisphaera mikurensis (strain NBRC 102666 / KCTC 22515 / FYK2301M01) TaxID=1142394 RepID=I0ICH3_PHYMF|nr:trehalose utilization protein ThuA [Phycisphaera mikurensis]MBB6442163.1 trehalose utilization protein [Phycisphaera mikurensis]BAM02961.1 hypothetical protein PSMK_08020 [Phycisphaera mikurensis NBRC 102666]
MLRVTVWHEHRHEKINRTVQEIYPDGMHAEMKSAIEEHLGDQVEVTTALLDQDGEHGLGNGVLENTDVLTWWGHGAHDDVRDEIAQRVAQRVREGMGFVPLHSAHYAKPFKLLLGTNNHLRWREAGERERLWVVDPGHPVTAGLDGPADEKGPGGRAEFFELPETEMYGEPFDVPTPDELVFVSWFAGGEVFRSGCGWKRGAGKIFYLRPGHETFPIYKDKNIRRVLANAVKHVAPVAGTTAYRHRSPKIEPALEKLDTGHVVDAALHEH